MNAWMLKSLRQDGVVFVYNLRDSVKCCLGVSGQPAQGKRGGGRG